MSRPRLVSALPGLLAAFCFLPPGDANAQASVTGQWTKAPNLPIVPIHDVLLPNGKIMMVGRDLAQTLWDPVTNAVSVLPSAGYDLFCYGHAYLPDGRVFAAGGHIADFVGLPNASIYSPATNSWTPVPDMNAGRWYPTVTTLPNGDMLVVSGQIDNTVGINPLPQVYQAATNTWRNLTSAQLNQNMYPMMFVAPNGKVVDVGPTNYTRYLDTSGTGAWTPIGFRKYGWRDYGSAVMYEAGKILQVGGGSNPPTAGAEVIDLNAAQPEWRAVQSMKSARRHLNATLLPDGTVLATGGTSGPGHNNAKAPVFAAELWNPATETWTTMASASVPRLYHSAALLLPDGRVVTTGGDGYPDVEIFSPPYLFKGARPTMSGVPASLDYGQRFTVQSPNATDIGKVTLIRLAAVTHAFDENQRMNILQFTRESGSLDITAPANANLAPPGHYMLFVLNSAGVPSVASIVQLGGPGTTPPPPSPAPALSSVSPNTAVAGGPAFTLTVNGSNFVSGATVRWNGAARPTTFASTSQVRAAIGSSDIATAGTANISVANPDGALSGFIPFTVSAAAGPAPVLSSISPNSATAGAPAFTLTVNGSNFVSGSTVLWNGMARSTSYVTATQLRASIPSSDVAAEGTANVAVANPDGGQSAPLIFTVSAVAPPPSAGNNIVSNPGFENGLAGWSNWGNSVAVTGQALTGASSLRVGLGSGGMGQLIGTPLTAGASYRFSGSGKVANANDVIYIGVKVLNSAGSVLFDQARAIGTTSYSTITIDFNVPQGGTQALAYVWKNASSGYGYVDDVSLAPASSTAPPPTVGSMSPNSATAGGPAFTLTVNGSNFASGATVRWNGAARSTTFVGSSQLTAAIPASDIAAAGTASISVANPNGSTTGTLPFTVSAAAPPPAGNLVSNPGFENGLAGWSNWGNSVAVTGQALTGASSLRVGLGSGGMGQLIATTVAPGETYRFRGSAKVADAAEVVFLGVKVLNPAGTTVLDQSRLVQTTGYSTITIDFTVPQGGAQAWVYVWKNAGSGYGYVDDLSLAAGSP